MKYETVSYRRKMVERKVLQGYRRSAKEKILFETISKNDNDSDALR